MAKSLESSEQLNIVKIDGMEPCCDVQGELGGAQEGCGDEHEGKLGEGKGGTGPGVIKKEMMILSMRLRKLLM